MDERHLQSACSVSEECHLLAQGKCLLCSFNFFSLLNILAKFASHDQM